MKKSILLVFFVMAVMSVVAQQKMTFVVGGPEKEYNQIRVMNETSLENFHCRVVVLDEDRNVKDVYGDYQLKEKGDTDTNTKDRIKRGTLIGVQFPKNFTEELSFYVEYRDNPMFDVIVIHLTDKDSEYDNDSFK